MDADTADDFAVERTKCYAVINFGVCDASSITKLELDDQGEDRYIKSACIEPCVLEWDRYVAATGKLINHSTLQTSVTESGYIKFKTRRSGNFRVGM